MKRKIFLCIFIVMVLCSVSIAAPSQSDSVVTKLDTMLDSEIASAKNGSDDAINRLHNILLQLQRLNLNTYTLEYMLSFLADKNIPDYVFARGEYVYSSSTTNVSIKHKNVPVRSQPVKNARLITTLNTPNSASIIFRQYLGEWTSPKGERWVLILNGAGDADSTGWIYASNVELVPNQALQQLISRAEAAYKELTKASVDWQKASLWIVGVVVVLVVVAVCRGRNSSRARMLKAAKVMLIAVLAVIAICVAVYLTILAVTTAVKVAAMIIGGAAILGSVLPPDDNKDKSKCIGRYTCQGCPEINRYDASKLNRGWLKCRHFKIYVNPNASPQQNTSDNVVY